VRQLYLIFQFPSFDTIPKKECQLLRKNQKAQPKKGKVSGLHLTGKDEKTEKDGQALNFDMLHYFYGKTSSSGI
jgi:hypothetical protein